MILSQGGELALLCVSIDILSIKILKSINS